MNNHTHRLSGFYREHYMKQTPFIIAALAAAFISPVGAHELPPSEVTPYELLSPREHANMYINLVSIIYGELIPLQNSVTNAESAALVGAKIEALHGRLNLAMGHMLHNPDMAMEVNRQLQANPAQRTRLEDLQRRYLASRKRCEQTNLITTREFVRHRNFADKQLIVPAE